MFKIIQARLQQYMNQELADVQARFRQRNQRSTCQHLLDHKIIPEKYLLLLYWLYQSLWPCGSKQAVENSSTDGNTLPALHHLTCLLRNLFAGQEITVRTGHGTMTGSKLGKEYIKAVHFEAKSQIRWRTRWNEDFQEKYLWSQKCRQHHA